MTPISFSLKTPFDRYSFAADVSSVSCFRQGYQTDWEAILSQSVEPFIGSVSQWLYPPEARGEAAGAARPFAPLEVRPDRLSCFVLPSCPSSQGGG